MYALSWLWHHSCNTDAWTCIHYENTHVTQMYEHVYIVTPFMWHRWLNMYTLWQHSRNTDAWTCIHYDTTHVTQMTEHVYITTTLMEHRCLNMYKLLQHSCNRCLNMYMYTLWHHSRNTDAWTCIHYDTTRVTQMTEHVYIMTTLM